MHVRLATMTAMTNIWIAATVDNDQHVLGSLVLPNEAESAHLAREWLGLIFEAWRIRQTENAQLCISELVANVVSHAAESANMRLVIGRYDGRVQVDVYDSSDRRPQIDRSTTMRESGNGLFFVEALADDWGCRALSATEGKCVWFAFDSAPRCRPLTDG